MFGISWGYQSLGAMVRGLQQWAYFGVVDDPCDCTGDVWREVEEGTAQHRE